MNVDVFNEAWKTWASALDMRSDVRLYPQVVNDSGAKSWADNIVTTCGGRVFAQHILSHPTSDVGILKARQLAIRSLPRCSDMLKRARVAEMDVMWLHANSTISIDPTSTLRLLYPHMRVLRGINGIPCLLHAFHLYRCHAAPWTTLLAPLIMLLAPYWYLRRSMKCQLPIRAYVAMVWTLATHALKPSGVTRDNVIKYGTVVAYTAMYIAGALHSFDVAAAIRRLRAEVMQRTRSVCGLLKACNRCLPHISPATWAAFGMADVPFEPIPVPDCNVGGAYSMLTDPIVRGQLTDVMRRVYVLDCIASVRVVAHTNQLPMCYPEYDAGADTRFFGMAHPALATDQVRNPLCLRRSLVITGPNAGGKTTYVRSICGNVLLSQSFGVVFASRALVAPVHVVGSYVQLTDTLGSRSLFEAEAARAAQMVSDATECSRRGQRALLFMDEPMQSTPPIEGAALATAVIEHLASIPGTRVIATTHHCDIASLAQMFPSKLRNVSMCTRSRYQLQPGPSFECVAAELLQSSGLPASVVARAAEWGSIFCQKHAQEV